jgi:hypothetical protein
LLDGGGLTDNKRPSGSRELAELVDEAADEAADDFSAVGVFSATFDLELTAWGALTVAGGATMVSAPARVALVTAVTLGTLLIH